MKKGTTHTEESKALIKERRADQPSPLIGRYGITDEDYKKAKELGLIWCRDCKKFLPKEFFTGLSTKKKFRRCADCNKNRSQKWRDGLNEEQKKARAERMAKWREEHRERPRRSPDRYGVDNEWFEQKLKEQDNHCALCSSTQGYRGHLNIDHDHRTGKVRGLLCTPCNIALERAELCSGWLERVSEYLDKYK